MKLNKPTQAGMALNDSVIRVLYQCSNTADKGQLETLICNRIENRWQVLNERLLNGSASDDDIKAELNLIDQWLDGKLSGESLFRLLTKAEISYPTFIRYMPINLVKRYEEIRLARIWSTLLDPESLIQLRAVIEFENSLKEMES